MNLVAVEEMLRAHRHESLKTAIVHVSGARLAVACGVPLLAAFGLFTAAAGYEHIIPAGEAAMRTSIVSSCVVTAVLALLCALLLLVHHFRGRLEIGLDHLVLHGSFSTRAYEWAQVTVGFPRGHAGMRHVTLGTPDGPITFSEVLYPGLQDCYGLMSERANGARRGMRH